MGITDSLKVRCSLYFKILLKYKISIKGIFKLLNFGLYYLTNNIQKYLKRYRPWHMPISVVLSITRKCNKSCSYCLYKHDLNPKSSNKYELSLQTFQRIINHRLIKNALRLNFYGGEPLLHAEIFQMIKLANREGFITTLSTNGVLIVEKMKTLQDGECYPHFISISYDTIPPDCNWTELAFLNQLSITSLYVLIKTEKDLQALDEIIEKAILAQIYMITINQLSHETNFLMFDHLFWNKTLPDLKQQYQKKFGTKIKIRWFQRFDKMQNCAIPWSSIYVNAKGETANCCIEPLTQYSGNIFSDPKIWKEDKTYYFRQMITEANHPSICKKCAWVYDSPLDL